MMSPQTALLPAPPAVQIATVSEDSASVLDACFGRMRPGSGRGRNAKAKRFNFWRDARHSQGQAADQLPPASPGGGCACPGAGRVGLAAKGGCPEPCPADRRPGGDGIHVGGHAAVPVSRNARWTGRPKA